jgi:Ca-activated chloride channel family protein
MLLRNSKTIVFLALTALASIASHAQGTPAPNQPAQNQPAQAQPAPPASVSVGQDSGPSTPPPPTQTAPAQAPAGQSQPADAAQGGDQSAPDTGGFVFKKQVEEVALHVTVVDKDRKMVTNLDKNAFSVLENGKVQPIKSFRHEDIPVAMGIVIDNSGSMRDKREKVGKAALNLVRASNPNDEVFVVNFNDDYYLDQDFTSDIKKLREALEKIDTKGGTALYDAIIAAWQSELKNAKLQKKVLFVVTDGADDESRNSLEQAVEMLQVDNGPTIYAIGILSDEDKPKKAKRALQALTERTGGIAFFPRTVDEVDEISSTVARDIRNQYSIVYKPTVPQAQGGYRTIQIDVKAKGYSKLTARTRSGYYAGQQRTSGGTQ